MSIELDNTEYYLNREFSMIAFNERVLTLANDDKIPLLERLRFLCICSGNLDEFFEIVTLIQTKKIEKVPVVLVGKKFWKPLDKFIRKSLCKKYKTISPKDLELYTITDDEDEIIKIIRSAPPRE